MPRVLFYIVIVSMLTCTAHGQYIPPTVENRQINEEPRNNDSFKIQAYEELCIHSKYNYKLNLKKAT